MNAYWHTRKGNDHLLLFFNGWGCDENIFHGITVPGHDVLILSDYTHWNAEFADVLDSYREISLLAWSFGVFLAGTGTVMDPRITRKVAVNGTPWPIDDKRGIPVRIFEGTLANYNEENRLHFFRRVMGGATAVLEQQANLPGRSTDSQLEELKAIACLAKPESPELHIQEESFPCWTHAVICQSDKIFPPRNMKNAWGNKAVMLEGNHFPDFRQIIDQFILS